LEEVIRRYPQIFDRGLALEHLRDPVALKKNERNINEMIDLFQQEIDFLLKVFVVSSDRSIDLTPSVFSAIEMINNVHYRIMKYRLQTGQETIVTKSTADQFSRSWVSHPLKELLKLKVTRTENSSHILIGEPAAPSSLSRLLFGHCHERQIPPGPGPRTTPTRW
jgi:hypothetical protein